MKHPKFNGSSNELLGLSQRMFNLMEGVGFGMEFLLSLDSDGIRLHSPNKFRSDLEGMFNADSKLQKIVHKININDRAQTQSQDLQLMRISGGEIDTFQISQ